MSFERFLDDGRRTYLAKASIGKSGMLGFNDAARKKFGLEDYGFAVLLFDRDSRRIGIILTKDEGEPGARKIRLRLTGADISAKSFFRHFEIDFSQTTSFPLAKDEASGYLVISLSEGKIRGEPS